MKQCPACRTTYSDESQSFCLNDGSVLVSIFPTQDSSSTLVLNDPQNRSNPQTEGFNSATVAAQQRGWTTPISAPMAASGPGRNLTPWLLGCGGVILLGLVALGLVFGVAMLNSGSKQSTGVENDTASDNSGSKTNSNLQKQNQSGSNNSNADAAKTSPSPSPPFAEFANRTGRYEGTALNTSLSPPTEGTMRIDVTVINQQTGYVAMMIWSGGKLCGDGPATGKINESGQMNLTGKLACNAISFPMATRCQFSTSDAFSCAYTLTSPTGYTPAIQHGTINVRRR